jgi:hypothetical protein
MQVEMGSSRTTTPDPLRGEAHTLPECDYVSYEAHVLRGAKLVATVHGDSKVIVQLPRGNLEGFEPRPLLLQQVCGLLDQAQVFECLTLLRRQVRNALILFMSQSNIVSTSTYTAH